MKNSISIEKDIIGWREWVAFPDLGICNIKAKIDTGARTSALHAYDITTYIDSNGKEVAEFYVHPIQKNDDEIIKCKSIIVDKRTVKSSIGKKQRRPTILTNLKMGKIILPIEVTLTNRDEMGFRLLIGRTAIKDNFLVNPGKSFMTNDKVK